MSRDSSVEYISLKTMEFRCLSITFVDGTIGRMSYAL